MQVKAGETMRAMNRLHDNLLQDFMLLLQLQNLILGEVRLQLLCSPVLFSAFVCSGVLRPCSSRTSSSARRAFQAALFCALRVSCCMLQSCTCSFST